MFNTSFSSQTCPAPADTEVEGLLRAITSCDLGRLETFIRQFKQAPDTLCPIVEKLGKRANTPELKMTARRFSYKQRGVTRWAVVVEFHLARTNRILLVPTEETFPSAVLEQNPGTVAVVSTDCPKLMLRQVGRMASLSTTASLPPLSSFTSAPPPMSFNSAR
jgi:hypothetical protein